MQSLGSLNITPTWEKKTGGGRGEEDGEKMKAKKRTVRTMREEMQRCKSAEKCISLHVPACCRNKGPRGG